MSQFSSMSSVSSNPSRSLLAGNCIVIVCLSFQSTKVPPFWSMPPTSAATVEGMGQRLGIGWNVKTLSIVGTLGRALDDEGLWAT
jgi:hypothetical protein